MSIPFKARPYQKLIVDHMLDVERCAVYAGMGVGKTSSTLAAANVLQLIDNRPILVLAPLRVARSTWPDEARKWKDFEHLKISPIVGSEKERLRALKYDANIYCCNYEQVPWLVDHFGERWPFATVVADESTKLKGFRLRQGTQRAKALARVAHTKVKRFIELTGTPSPNGLNDLWGQAWFLDKGHRLGKTYDAFRQRWFEKSYDGFSITPKDHAQRQIQEALRDLCITIDAKDWFDLREPVVTNIYVDLPAKARALYEDMEKRMFMEIEEHAVEAFGAAARTVKCIAAGTEILTSNGWKCIEQWQPGDRLWDGVQWVEAEALVCNGEMPVVKCLHVTMTPDHKVLTTEGWKTAEEINNADASRRLDRAPVRIPDRIAPCWHDDGHTCEARYLDGSVRLRQRVCNDWTEPAEYKSRREEIMRLPAWRDAPGSVGDSRYVGASGLGDLVQYEIALRKLQRQGLEELRRARHYIVRALETIRCVLAGHGADILGGADAGEAEQQRRLRAGELHLGGSESTGQQYPAQRVYPDTSGQDDGISGGGYVRGETGNAGPASAPGVVDRESADSAFVYDLVNCGPRHRFTVRGTDGELLIVHNCLQICNGAAYVGDDSKDWREVHNAKIDALEEIIEEAAGMPVLVAYNFKSDLARLLKAFPQGRQLDADPQTIVDWNAGKIPVLFAHPASAGHGLNLQDGGNILVFFGMDWNLENRLQIIERIGPTRQMQAGHDRAMFIYNILARDTVDDLVLQRVESKREVQDLLLEAMKIKGYK